AGFNSTNAMRSFLYTTVKNSALNWLKHERVKQAAHISIAQKAAPYDETQAVYEAELLRLIYAEIAVLPDKYRQVLELTFIENLSNKEIAGRLHYTESRVRVEKTRALVLLRTALRKKQAWHNAVLLYLLWWM
ncbi:MAG: sigma-70 family RNA polymerase sigma factor, partial [Chitinophagaceae bacterium]|nr:sigma-70 family RNA polymerase sigma factor [Chitinophagaceae bacterium]